MVVISVSVNKSLMKFEEIDEFEKQILTSVMDVFLDDIFQFLKDIRGLFYSFILTKIRNICNTTVVYIEFAVDTDDYTLNEKSLALIHFFIAKIREENSHLSISYIIRTTGKRAFKIELYIHISNHCFQEDNSDEEEGENKGGGT